MVRTAAQRVHVLALADKISTLHGCGATLAKLTRLVRSDVKLLNLIFIVIDTEYQAKYIVQHIVGKVLSQWTRKERIGAHGLSRHRNEHACSEMSRLS